MNAYKKYYLLRIIFSVLFGGMVGVAFLLLAPYASEAFEILIIALGLLTAVMNLPALFLALMHIRERGEWLNLVMALFAILLGVALMLLQADFLLLLLSVYSIVLPFVRVLLVKDHKGQMKREVPKIFTGLLMLVVFLSGAEELLFIGAAIFSFVLSAIYLAYGLIVLHIRFS